MQIIDVTKMPNTGKVIFGTTVTIVNVETDAEVKYQCPIPPHLSCALTPGAGKTYACTIGDTQSKRNSMSDNGSPGSGTTSSSSSGSSSATANDSQGGSANGATPNQWSFRYFRGKRTL